LHKNHDRFNRRQLDVAVAHKNRALDA
jgi:hypothetical protein